MRACFKNLIPLTFKKTTLQGIFNVGIFGVKLLACVSLYFTACFDLLAVVLHVVFVD